MSAQPPSLVIFDCDGVLVDSEPVANACLQDALAREGLMLEVSEVRRRYVGLSMISVVTMIEAELGRSLGCDWLNDLQALTFARLKASVKPVPYIHAAVEQIQEAGIKTCVASSGSIAKMTLTLGATGLLPLFAPRLFSASGVARGKPYPDLFEWAARANEVEPDSSIVIEDALPGVQAARAARMHVLGFAGDPFTDATALEGAGATIFRDMRDLPALLGLS